MIRLEHIGLSRGQKHLFDHVSLSIYANEKIGLVGQNGSGKSSFFSLLNGKITVDAGQLELPAHWQIACVSQEMPASTRSALAYTLDGDVRLRAIETRIAQAEKINDGILLSEAHTALAEIDGYSAPARAKSLLLGLGFKEDELEQPINAFSGGWRMRLNLAQALISKSDLLLLDEPTNHLDLDAIIWLEQWLQRYPGTLMLISHDRDFLDATCQSIFHIENQTIKRYKGNYSQFEILKAEQENLQQSAYEKQQKHIAHLQHFIDRFKAKKSKAKQAQSRVKTLDKMLRLAPIHAHSTVQFQFRTPQLSPNPLIALDQVSCGYATATENKIILKNIQFSLQDQQRIGLLGANGKGKSTFIKTLAGILPPLSGHIQFGKGLQIGYFAQHQLEMLDPQASPLLHLMRLASDTPEQTLRQFLSTFHFQGDMAKSPIAPFSGGEKARLALALIVWQKPNLLLLDEPTNHLDLAMREALAHALTLFEGSMILVSHDRHLLNATTDQFFLIDQQQIAAFDGDLEDYRHWLNQTRAIETPASKPIRTTNAHHQAQRAEQAKIKQQIQTLKKRIATTEAKMAQLETEKQQLEQFITQPEHYQGEATPSLIEATKQLNVIQHQLTEHENTWLDLQQQLENASL